MIRRRNPQLRNPLAEDCPIRRRTLVAIGPATLATPSLAVAASPALDSGEEGTIERFLALPGTKSCLVHAAAGNGSFSTGPSGSPSSRSTPSCARQRP
jgi:hypothetical protein